MRAYVSSRDLLDYTVLKYLGKLRVLKVKISPYLTMISRDIIRGDTRVNRARSKKTSVATVIVAPEFRRAGERKVGAGGISLIEIFVSRKARDRHVNR